MKEVQITIRGVPQAVRDEVAARAAHEGKSMQEYLLAHLEQLVSRPPYYRWLEQVQARKRASGVRVTPEQILAHRNADRR